MLYCTVNTANKLTISRVTMIPLFLIILYLNVPFSQILALVIFILASVTDLIDGYVARHYDQVTDFGKFMDPLADKVLVISAMLWFVEVGQMPAWIVAVVVARELLVTGLRLVAMDNGRVIAAAWSGKVKTATTMVCICLMLLPIPSSLNTVCAALILITTVYSGLEYFIKNRDVLNLNNL